MAVGARSQSFESSLVRRLRAAPPPCRGPAPRAGIRAAVLIALLVAQSAAAQSPRAAEATRAADEAAKSLAALLEKLPSGTRVGLAVQNAESGEEWFARDADVPLKPASVLKLFVTAAALDRLGASFQFETVVAVEGDELWVIGGGDPGVGDERIARRRGETPLAVFDRWAAALKARGVRRVGKIVLDDSIFDRQWTHPDWDPQQHEAWYQAPVGGLNLNDNCLDVSVRVAGGQVQWEAVPPLPPEFITSRLVVAERTTAKVSRGLGSDIFTLSGGVAGRAALRPVSAGEPTIFFGHALRQALAERGVEVAGPVVRRTIRPEHLAAASIVDRHTTSLEEVLWRCNTFSQNLFAECLVKSLAAYEPDGSRSGTPGSWTAGTRVVRETLRRRGVDVSGAEIRDGSGLSHENRVTAAQVAALLTMMESHPHAGLWQASLAEPGRDGTMRRRFAEAALEGRVRAKTGTIRGVSTLAGYVDRSDGTRLAFALLINGPAPAELPQRVLRVLADAR